jgi:hypothetical protein
VKYEIIPNKGMNGILFGMDAQKVRTSMGTGFESFKRTPDAAFPCDYFADVGIFANYDKAGHLEAIELASPAAPALYEINLLRMRFDEALKYLKSKDPQLDQEADGAISLALGISLYAPHSAQDPNMPAESVLLFAAGYYD